MAESIILDPVEINPARTQLDITQWIKADGVDWGDSAIDAYMANLDIGSLPSGFRLPNRQISIPMILRTKGATTYDDIRSKLRRKIGLLQSKRGSLVRRSSSTGDLFADVVNASLHLGGDTLAAFRDVDVNAAIKIECLPDMYGPEVVTDVLNATSVLSSPLKVGGINAVIGGDYPARTRIVVGDTSAQVQKNLYWALQRDHYDSAATAELFYEAEAMTPQNGAAIAVSASGSGGNKVSITGTPANVWIPVLITNLISGNQPLTHKGTFRVIARCSCGTGIPSFRLKWGVGSLATPTLNNSVALPGDASGSWYLLDLGVVRLDAAPVGTHQWFGIIHTFSPTGNDDIGIDCVYLQPLDEGSGRLLSLPPPDDPTSNTKVKAYAGHGLNNAIIGTAAWSYPNEIRYVDLGHYSFATINNSQSNRLRGDKYGLSIPAGATILGVRVRVSLSASDWVYGALRLLKQNGTSFTADKGKWIEPTYFSEIHFGSSTDLWGSAWVPGDFNGTVFGAEFNFSTDYDGDVTVNVYFFRVTVFYRLGTMLGIADDAVVYASSSTEIRTDGVYHTPDGSVYGPVSDVRGQLPRLPPSGLENLPVRLFLRPSRGDVDQWWPDAGLDAFTVQVRYRPCYLGKP